jgi:pimeloyl-ACP methyl ester carboxylesterase
MSVSSRALSSQLGRTDQVGVAVQNRRVCADGVKLQYLEAGSGPPLLLLHGHEQSATSWRWVCAMRGPVGVGSLGLCTEREGRTGPPRHPRPGGGYCGYELLRIRAVPAEYDEHDGHRLPG